MHFEVLLQNVIQKRIDTDHYLQCECGTGVLILLCGVDCVEVCAIRIHVNVNVTKRSARVLRASFLVYSQFERNQHLLN